MNSLRPKPLSDRPLYLIADLHLEAGSPGTTQLLLDFLRGPATRASGLFILGDLFEVWIGDDGAGQPAVQVARALKSLSDDGVAVYFLCGNRDFLLGDAYCAQAGMQRLEEPLRLDDVIPATALMHGDTLCTDDLDYQRFRARVRDPRWQSRTLSRPLWWRRILSRVARAISRQKNRGKPAAIMDVNGDAVAECFRSLGVDRLIHGHTHRPAIHRLRVDGKPVERVVLGDWHPGRGSTVCIQPDGRLELIQLDHDSAGELRMQTLDQAPGSGQ